VTSRDAHCAAVVSWVLVLVLAWPPLAQQSLAHSTSRCRRIVRPAALLSRSLEALGCSKALTQSGFSFKSEPGAHCCEDAAWPDQHRCQCQAGRKGTGKEGRPSQCGDLLVENRNGLIADAELLEVRRTGGTRVSPVVAGTDAGRPSCQVSADSYDSRGFCGRMPAEKCGGVRGAERAASSRKRN
jgi:hypothetical protein